MTEYLTYVSVKGEWMYLYRVVNKARRTVDFFLSRKRDVNAAKAFPWLESDAS